MPSTQAPTNFPTSTSSSAPSSKRLRVPKPNLPLELGKYIEKDVKLLSKLGWQNFVKQRRQRSDLNILNINHPAQHVLKNYKHNGVPVRFSTKPWSKAKLTQALRRGPHQSCHNYIDFLESEFSDMISKSQWVILPFDVAKSLPNLRLSPPGVIPQRDRRPRWICDYSFYGVNQETLPLVPTESMQFGRALERYLRELLLADPANGTLYMLKLDISDGYYRMALTPSDIPKLGVVFPTPPNAKPLVALPLVLPMGWKNSPPAFCAASETSADIANINLSTSRPTRNHPLESHAAKYDEHFSPPITLPAHNHQKSPHNLLAPTARDPSLPTNQAPIQYIDVFVDDFLGICQGEKNKSHVRQTLLHAVDDVFRPNDFHDSLFRREPVSLKKLRQGDCSWSTIKQVLGWIINTATMTISLPEHRQERLGEILASVPLTQKRLSVKRWHKILGELRSMSLALPGSRGLFSSMQLALSKKSKNRIKLRNGVHQAINDFRWLHKDICNRPTRIAEIIPLSPSALGYHDAAGIGAGGVWYPTPDLTPRQGTHQQQPLLWRLQWPQDIVESLVSSSNPNGTINNSALELAGGLLHLDVIAQEYDTRE